MSSYNDDQAPTYKKETASAPPSTTTAKRHHHCLSDLLAHFELTAQPFALAPDPRFFFRSKQHRELFARLWKGLAQYGGVTQLTGDVGTGKTLLYRRMLKHLPRGIDVALVLNAKQTPQELTVTICDELRVIFPYGSHSLKALRQKLRRSHVEGRRTVVIVDEAQNLEMPSLVRLLLLSELTHQKNKLLQIILIGQPALNALIAKLDLRPLAENITARYELKSLSPEQTADYIAHRLCTAGAKWSLFTPTALRAVYRHSSGNPRLINRICKRALIASFSAREGRISAAFVQRAAEGVSRWD
jgi:general secretion pathway protein A